MAIELCYFKDIKYKGDLNFMQQIYLRKATLADRDIIMKIINEAKATLKAAGSPQWQDGHPNLTMITEDISREIGWVLVINHQLAGYTAMLLKPEPDYQVITDGHWQVPDQPYATFHRVAISDHFRGQHLSRFMFSNLLTIGISLGFHNFRLDTFKKNVAMQTLAKSFGFVARGHVEVKDKINPHRIGFELNLQPKQSPLHHITNDFMAPLTHRQH